MLIKVIYQITVFLSNGFRSTHNFVMAMIILLPLLNFVRAVPAFSQDKDNEKINHLLHRKDRAVLFAIDEYDEWPRLNNPTDDASALRRS